jgi:uncharacterized membrane protein
VDVVKKGVMGQYKKKASVQSKHMEYSCTQRMGENKKEILKQKRTYAVFATSFSLVSRALNSVSSLTRRLAGTNSQNSMFLQSVLSDYLEEIILFHSSSMLNIFDRCTQKAIVGKCEGN